MPVKRAAHNGNAVRMAGSLLWFSFEGESGKPLHRFSWCV